MNIFRAITAIVAIIIGSFVAVHPSTANAAELTSYSVTLPAFPSPETFKAEISVYVVKPGDTLSSIAEKYGTDWRDLYCANQQVIGSDPDNITPGERLVIGSAQCHISQGGTTATTASTTSVVSGSPQSIAWGLLPSNNRAAEYACLSNIIVKESGWRVTAENASGAYGIPQALPGYKMGPGWQYSAYVQLHWMIDDYIPSVYGTPCGAWGFWQLHGWY